MSYTDAIIKALNADPGKPSYILCNGKDMNAIGNCTHFPEDHIFEWTSERNDWRDLTLGIDFKDMK